jgi:hypothetical protein
VTELLLASGPLRYLGGSIETFALPYGTFIVIAWVLFYIYRRPHSVPRLKYLRPAHQIALATREPGTEGLITMASASAAPATPAPAQAAQVQTGAAQAEPEATALGSAEAEEPEPEHSDAGPGGTSAEGETT